MNNEKTLLELEDVAAKLTIVALDECDPEKWPGGSKPVSHMSREEKEDRIGCKKGAALTLSLLAKINDIIGDYAPGTERGKATAASAEAREQAKEFEEAQRETAAIVARLQSKIH